MRLPDLVDGGILRTQIANKYPSCYMLRKTRGRLTLKDALFNESFFFIYLILLSFWLLFWLFVLFTLHFNANSAKFEFLLFLNPQTLLLQS